MPLYYALIAKDPQVILAEYSSFKGNFSKVASKLMPKI